MKIKRTINGEEIEIELTSEEIERAFRIRELEYHKEDVELEYENTHDNECPYTDNEKRMIAEYFVECLENSDTYWDAYWNCMDYAIDNFNDWDYVLSYEENKND